MFPIELCKISYLYNYYKGELGSYHKYPILGTCEIILSLTCISKHLDDSYLLVGHILPGFPLTVSEYLITLYASFTNWGSERNRTIHTDHCDYCGLMSL